MEITWLAERQGLAEIYSSGLQYAWLSEDNKQACPFVYCKDFLQDALQGLIHGESKGIYGFNYNPKNHPPLAISKIRLLIANQSDRSFSDKIPAVVEFINKFEAKLGINKTKTIASSIDNPPKSYEKCGVWVLESNRRWLIAAPMLSLYTLLIRVGFTHKLGNTYEETVNDLINGKSKSYQRNDREYLTSSQKGIERIVKYGDKKVFFLKLENNYPKATNVSNMHNNYGIVSFSNDNASSYQPKHWHRDIDKEVAKEIKKEVKKVKEEINV